MNTKACFSESLSALRRMVMAALLLAAIVAGAVEACPFCAKSQRPTLGEQQALAEVIAVASWKKMVPAKGERGAETTFEITELLKSNPKGPAKGSDVVVPVERPGPKGTLELWFGATSNGDLEWTYRVPVSAEAVAYLKKAPPRDVAERKRLQFYLQFLEHDDPAIADDAFQEFASARFEDVQGAVQSFDSKKVRSWLANENLPVNRRGLYGLMLGLTGSADDEEFFRQQIESNTDEIRIGIDGVIGGYLYLAGEKGMEFVERTKIIDPATPFSETYSAMQALRFLWTYGSDRVPRERILSAMRRLVDRAAVCDIVINDLARWKDWSQQEKLMKLYGTKDYDLPSIKRAIIRYMVASTKDVPTEEAGELPAHAVMGQKNVDALRERDPKRVAEVERFFFPQ